MKYTDSKEQSLALLRAVVAEFGRHDATPDPIAYAVFYEYAGGVNPRLSKAIDATLQASPRLDDAAVERLYRDFVAEASTEDTARIQGDMQRMMANIAETAARTGREAGLFGEQLGGLSGALATGDTRRVDAQVQEALQSTRAMQQSVATLRSQVEENQREIERLRADLSRSREEATMCPLTRVLNRRGFDLRLTEVLHTRPSHGAAHCLILVDIDHFKRVNDTHGHPVGDRVLAGLGEVLRSIPSEPGMSCARYGGEEFAILLPQTTLARAVQVAENVRARAGQMRLRNRSTQEVIAQVTVSAGVAAWQPGEDGSAFVACADAALYRSKENGRNRVTVA
jgi:diguanylate cyclase